ETLLAPSRRYRCGRRPSAPGSWRRTKRNFEIAPPSPDGSTLTSDATPGFLNAAHASVCDAACAFLRCVEPLCFSTPKKAPHRIGHRGRLGEESSEETEYWPACDGKSHAWDGLALHRPWRSFFSHHQIAPIERKQRFDGDSDTNRGQNPRPR